MPSKKRTSKKPISKLSFGNRRTKWHASLVIAIVVAIGVWRLWVILAAPSLPDNNHIIFQLSHVGGQSLHINPDNTVVYEQKPISIQLNDDGRLICDNGSNDSYNMVDLSPQELLKVRALISDTGIDRAESVIPAPTPEGNGFTDADTIIVRPFNEDLKSVTAAKGQTKPPAFIKAEKLLRLHCQRATRRSKITANQLNKPALNKLPRIVKMEDLTDNFFPKVEAATAIGPYTRVEDIMHFTNNSHRTNYNGAGYNDYGTGLPHPVNVPALSKPNCLRDAARAWARHMTETGQYGHSDLRNWMIYFCGTGWSHAGENIGYYNWTGSVSTDLIGKNISTMYLQSRPHHEHIDYSVFRLVGYGAFKATFSDGHQTMYTTQQFLDRVTSK